MKENIRKKMKIYKDIWQPKGMSLKVSIITQDALVAGCLIHEPIQELIDETLKNEMATTKSS